jgi:molybdopterin molybdotransferase
MDGIDAITALVLAGGKGTRMGSVDKGLQPFRGQAMVQHVLARLRQQAGPVLVNANQNQDAYARFGFPVHADETSGFQGPLAGLETGLRHCSTAWMLTAPCDSPFLPPDLAARLLKAVVEEQADLAMAVTREADGREQDHPVFCLLKATLLPQVSAYLAGGGRRMDGWHAGLKVARVMFDDATAFRNINTAAELQTYGAPSIGEITSCLSDYDPEALSVVQAQNVIGQFVAPVAAVEQVALRSALGRVLAHDLISPINVPSHDNSAMDGYALRGEDLRTDTPTVLAIAATVVAGHPAAAPLQAGQCARIMTGGVMPDGCDTVIPQELVADLNDSSITIAPGSVRSGDNRRFKGEDLMAGSAALRQGRVVRPADLGLIASLGIAEVPVRRRLRVAFFSTGDELRSIGEPLDDGCVYDSNRYTLFGMLERLGCEVIDMGIVKDNPGALEAAMRTACESADAIVTSGGVSVGAADHTRQIMARLGDVTFWKLNMRPGRPLAFGRVHSGGHSAVLFGLPGNPVAVMVSFYFFARSALLKMMGADAPLPLIKVKSAGAIRKKPGRTEYQRGIFDPETQEVRITGAQGSGILRSMVEANCMVVLHQELGSVNAGDLVDVLLFEGLL